MSFAQINQMGGLMAAPQRPANPFADNADYMALQEYQRSLGPTEDELARLRELQTAFTSSDAYQSHQQEQQQRQQMMQMMRQQQRGIMGQAPMQMQRQVPKMRHPMQQGDAAAGSDDASSDAAGWLWWWFWSSADGEQHDADVGCFVIAGFCWWWSADGWWLWFSAGLWSDASASVGCDAEC